MPDEIFWFHSSSKSCLHEEYRWSNINYCIKPTLPVRYKHVLTGENRALTGENVYYSVNSRAVNDWFVCSISSIRAYLVNNVCWTFVLVNSKSSDQHGCRNLFLIQSFFGSSLMTWEHHKRNFTQNLCWNEIHEQNITRNDSTDSASSHPLLKRDRRFLRSISPADIFK